MTLYSTKAEAWDDAVIPVLQQLPQLEHLRMEIHSWSGHSPARLSGNLMPFMAMPKLSTIKLGQWQSWTASSLRLLGQYQAELLRSGSNLELTYK